MDDMDSVAQNQHLERLGQVIAGSFAVSGGRKSGVSFCLFFHDHLRPV